MKKLLLISFSALLLCNINGYSQCANCYGGFNHNPALLPEQTPHLKKVGNGSGSLGIVFDTTLCGLNYIQAVQITQTRYNASPGTGFPAPDTVRGLPVFSPCTKILKAYLYCEASTKVQPATYTITDTVTNPLAVKSVFTTTLLGTAGPCCWGDVGTGTWRADITSIISGNGVYKVNVSGFTLPDWEVNGITMVIIYKDNDSTYTGTFILADGQMTIDGGTLTSTDTGFHACAASTYANAFMDLCDVQNNVGPTFPATLNNTTFTFNSDFFQSAELTTSVTAGQNTSTFTMSRPGDCYSMFLTGLYFQTHCHACAVSQAFNYSLSTHVSPCNKDSGSAKVHVSDTGNFTYHWSNGSTADSIFNVGAGVYTLTITGPGGCYSDTVLVTITPADSMNVHLSVSRTITCYEDSNGAIISTVSRGRTPYTYSWSNNATTSSITGIKAGTYTLVTSDGSGCSLFSIITITQPPAIGKLTTSIVSTCYGDTTGSIKVSLSGGIKPYTYQWHPNISITDSAHGLKQGKYIISILDASGCGVIDTAIVGGPGKIVPIITGLDSICLGYPDTLRVRGGNSYLWSNNSVDSSIIESPFTQTFTVTATVGACSQDTTFTIKVDSIPNPVITSTKDSVCSKDSLTLSGSGGSRYLWKPGNSNKSTLHVSPTIATTYTLYAFGPTCLDSAVKTIGIIKRITSVVGLSKDSICQGTTTSLDVITSGSAALSYIWSTGATGTVINVTPNADSTYYVVAIGRCNRDSVAHKVNVIPMPVPVVSPLDSVCKGFNDTLTVSGATLYLWNNGSTKTTYIIKGLKGDSTLTLIAYNYKDKKCKTFDTIHIPEKLAPTVSTTRNAIVCAGSCITLNAKPSGGGNYTYSWSNGATIDSATVCPNADSTFYVVVSNGCKSPKTPSAVQVYPSSLFVCCDTTISIIVQGANHSGDTAILTADKAKTYLWTPSSSLNCNTCKTVIATPSVTTTYTVNGIDSNGCVDVTTVTVIVDYPCFNYTIPNVFTPNGDKINDNFVIKTANIDGYSIIIYDRWGKEVYKSSDPNQSWDGNTESGSKAYDGVYYYVITSICQGKTYDKQGFVQLIR